MRYFFKHSIVLVLLLFSIFKSSGQLIEYPDTLHKKRLKAVAYTHAGLWSVSMVGLSQLWYDDYSSGGFHSFDDSDEWLQMDKAGHFMTAYYLNQITYESYRWSGLKNKPSAWIGSGISFSYLLGIEVLDGMSEGWGFSWSDLAANSAGTGMFLAQQLLWQEQRIQLKYSYHSTEFAQYRPNLLGSSWNERMLKDYNGQTYWASFNLRSFAKQSKIPKWLNVAIGYGADGMVGGVSNPIEHEGQLIPYFKRQREYYLGFDLDVKQIPTRSKFLKYTLTVLSFIKVPAPTLSVNENGVWKGHWLYF